MEEFCRLVKIFRFYVVLEDIGEFEVGKSEGYRGSYEQIYFFKTSLKTMWG